MSNVTVIGPSQPSRSPRLARSAYAISLAGHSTTVITPFFELDFLFEDKQQETSYGYTYKALSVINKNSKINYFARLARKASLEAERLPFLHRLKASHLYYKPQCFLDAIIDSKPDTIVAHQHAVFSIAILAAKKLKVPCILDVEDILSSEPGGPIKTYSYIEKTFLPMASHVTTMSPAASDYLRISCCLQRSPIVIYNSPEKTYNHEDQINHESSEPTDRKSMYWMGKTIGPHSCAREVLNACIDIGMPFDIYLRGNAIRKYTDGLLDTAREAGYPSQLHILPSIPYQELLFDASNHDILIGSQPAGDFFHELAVGNKVCLGAKAGNALLLQDTIAHKSLPVDILEASCFFDVVNPHSIRAALGRLANEPGYLASLRQKSYIAGVTTLGWTAQMEKLQALIKSL